NNIISYRSCYSTIGGGRRNTGYGCYGTISGGRNNLAGAYGTINGIYNQIYTGGTLNGTFSGGYTPTSTTSVYGSGASFGFVFNTGSLYNVNIVHLVGGGERLSHELGPVEDPEVYLVVLELPGGSQAVRTAHAYQQGLRHTCTVKGIQASRYCTIGASL
ncbi:MAG: hypothetical protein ACK55I_36905, partial [bacterium]